MTLYKFGVSVAASLLALSTVACGADPMEAGEPEAIDSVSQPFSVGSCSSPTANEVDSGIIASHSPASYNTGSCYNGYIVDVTDWDTDNATTIYQEWAAAAPTTSANCAKAWMSLIVYQWENDHWFQLGQQRSTFGSWDGSSCRVPKISWDSQTFVDGKTYRFAGTARPYYAATTTRDFRLAQDDG